MPIEIIQGIMAEESLLAEIDKDRNVK